MTHRFFPAAAALLLMATAAPAQTVLSGNHSVDGNLCAGPDCSNTEGFPGSADIKLKSFDTRLLFEDSSTAAGAPTVDWELRANDAGIGFDYFAIRNADTGSQIFRLDDGAPANSLYVDDDGNVGMGTSIPQAALQVETSSLEGIRLNRFNAGPSGQSWETQIFSNGDFGLSDISNATTPFAMRPGTPNNAIFLEFNTAQVNAGSRDYNFEVRWDNGTSFWADGGTGNVGIGTFAPAAPLHVSSNDTFTFFRVEALGASPNTAADMTFTSGPAGSGGEYRINVVDGDGPEMRVDGAGFVTAFAGFKVGATTLNVPDYVFEPDYALRPLSEVQAFIDTNKHLPDVPSATDVARDGLDMTDMQLTLLKKVEELTLYTLEQQETITALSAKNAAYETRMARLEAMIGALASR